VLVWLRAVAVAAAAFWSVLFFGLIDLSTMYAPGEFEAVVPLEASWGVFFTFVVAGAFVSVALRPEDRLPPAVQLLVAAVAVAMGAALGLRWEPLPVAVVLALSGVLLLRRSGGRSRWSRQEVRVSWPLLVVAAAALPFWGAYAWSAFASARLGVDDDITNGIPHWPLQGSTGLALAVCAVLAAVWPRGRRLLATSTCLSATLLGAATLAYPVAVGAMAGRGYGLAAMVWGLAVGLLPPTREPAR
jgi:hypothetical protein